MENNKNNDNINVHFESFSRNITPLPIESKEKDGDKMVKWGEDNLYPNFLIDISNNSAIHGGILEKKTTFVYGDGVIDKKSGEDISNTYILNEDGDTIGDLTKKIVNDLMVFGGFAVKVDFNVLNQPLYYSHVPFNHIRSNRSNTKFFVNDDWFNSPRSYFSYNKYKPKNNDTGDSKIFYFKSYSISTNNVYPTPDYKCIESAVTDMLIDRMYSKNVGNSFSLMKIIKTFRGDPSDDDKRRTTQKFKDVFTGIDGDSIMFEFNKQDGKAMEVDTIPADDYASKMVEIVKKVERNILSGHGATSPLLFGVDKEGSTLGGSGNELNTAYEIFKTTYVNDKAKEVVTELNKMFREDENIPTIDLAIKDIIIPEKVKLSDATLEKILTKNELRELIGFEAVEGGEEYVPQPQLFKPNTFSDDSKKKDELTSYTATPEDYDKIAHLGSNKDEFIYIKDDVISEEFGACCNHTTHHFATTYLSIEEYLLENKIVGLSLDEATAKISENIGQNVSKKEVKEAIANMKANGLIDSTSNLLGKINTTPAPIANNAVKVEVYYDYRKRPNVSGTDIIPTTRHFCESIINSNKYYSAIDIQNFSSILGYNVMEFCGGFYHNPKTNITTPFCRHEWTPVRVIKR